jgi:hypothetical protein
MFTRLHNDMDTSKGHAHYRYGICNDTWHNRKTCPNRQHMYKNLLGHVMIYYDIFVKHIKLI